MLELFYIGLFSMFNIEISLTKTPGRKFIIALIVYILIFQIIIPLTISILIIFSNLHLHGKILLSTLHLIAVVCRIISLVFIVSKYPGKKLYRNIEPLQDTSLMTE